MERARMLGELKASGYRPQSVKDEMRANLICKLKRREKLFPGIVGYDETVVPQLVNAILARHSLILLGLRGQAKTRIIRQLTNLLDEFIPIIAGSEINDDPFNPISAYGRQTIELHQDSTPIAWVNRDARFVEKLATPDVTIADIIGDDVGNCHVRRRQLLNKARIDRKSTRLNSSHRCISYAVFCLKKKTNNSRTA